MRIGVIGVGRIGAFHAATLKSLPVVGEVIVADADPGRAQVAAKDLEVGYADDLDVLLGSCLDGLVIAAATAAHAELVGRSLAAGLTTFCEKPLAHDLAGTRAVVARVEAGGAPVQIGFQRRFDAGYRAAARAVLNGDLGWIHSIRANTSDLAPPPAEYLPTSGGFFRDCAVHDFDIVRFVTGREVTEVYAAGANRGAAFFAEADDVDAAAALLTLDDGTFVTITGTRYNAAGYDVRLELLGSDGSLAVGLDQRTALRSAEPAARLPSEPPHTTFLDRFHDAYVAELAAFAEVVAGSCEVPCTVHDALEAFRIAEACELSRREHRVVAMTEIPR